MYDHYKRLIDILFENMVDDNTLNGFIEGIAFDEELTPDEYASLNEYFIQCVRVRAGL